MHQGAGQSPPPVRRVGFHRLESGETVTGAEEAHLRNKCAVDKGTEPATVARCDQPPVAGRFGGGEFAVPHRLLFVLVASQAQVDVLRPVVVGDQLPVDGLRVRTGRQMHGRRSHHRLGLGVHPTVGKPLQLVSCPCGAIDADRKMLCIGKFGGETVEPMLAFRRCRHIGQQ